MSVPCAMVQSPEGHRAYRLGAGRQRRASLQEDEDLRVAAEGGMGRGVGAGREKGRLEHPVAGSIRLVPGARDRANLHWKAIPQKDQLCGPFWGALALAAAGYPVDQDEVARLAGTTLAEGDPAEWLPPGASPRTDYGLPLPVSPDKASSGTSASGLARSIEVLSEDALRVIPVAGPWTAESAVSLVEISASEAPGCTLVANLRTGRLWGSRPRRGSCSTTCSGCRPRRPPRTGTAGTS